MLLHPLPGFIEFVLQIHNIERIQGIDNCQSQPEPVVISFGNWFKIVMTPREFFVPFPGMFERFNCGTLSLIWRTLNKWM